MNYDQMIEVIQAEKDGKKIELRTRGSLNSWSTRVATGSFNFVTYEYRVKKEPRVLYARILENGAIQSYGFDREAIKEYHKYYGGEIVKFVEVMDEE